MFARRQVAFPIDAGTVIERFLAEMMIDSFHCPQCGAPLPVGSNQAFGVCAYCNSSFRISWGAEGTSPQLTHSGVKPETMKKVKQLLTDGQRSEALRLFQDETGLGPQDAEKTIAHLVDEIGVSALNKVPLTRFGVFVVCFFLITGIPALVWSIVQVAGGTLLIGLPVGTLSLLGLLFALSMLSSLKNSILIARAEEAEATILNWAKIGDLKLAGHKYEVFRLLLEVHPKARTAFQVHTTAALFSVSMDRLQPGKTVPVRCDPRDPTKILPLGLRRFASPGHAPTS